MLFNASISEPLVIRVLLSFSFNFCFNNFLYFSLYCSFFYCLGFELLSFNCWCAFNLWYIFLFVFDRFCMVLFCLFVSVFVVCLCFVLFVCLFVCLFICFLFICLFINFLFVCFLFFVYFLVGCLMFVYGLFCFVFCMFFVWMLVLRLTIDFCSLFKVRHVMVAVTMTSIEYVEKVFDSRGSRTRDLLVMSRLI